MTPPSRRRTLTPRAEKTLRGTVALTAARGRGKSAALGLAVAGALGLGYSNIFVTAPSPENLRTLFEFVFKGLDELGYKVCGLVTGRAGGCTVVGGGRPRWRPHATHTTQLSSPPTPPPPSTHPRAGAH